MTWRTSLGFKPTQADLAQDLLKIATERGLTGWQYDANAGIIRNGDQSLNLSNIHIEYANASRDQRNGLLQKYSSLLVTPTVSKLWSLAQTKLYPLLRSRYERVSTEIDFRRKETPLPARAGRRFLGNLDQVLGYDLGSTVTQVTAETFTHWGVTLEAAIDSALTNLRALPPPTWQAIDKGVWHLKSPGGYEECMLQLPKAFENFPGKGQPLSMVPNRGVLLATGADEPEGLANLLKVALDSLRSKPWPLSSDLLRITATGPQVHAPPEEYARRLHTIQLIDIGGVYQAQKAALQAHCKAVGDDVFIATFSLFASKDSPDDATSLCVLTEGVRSSLPITEKIAFLKNPNGQRELIQVRWTDAERLVGHYFKPTDEDPPRIRVDEFPNAEELAQLQKCVI